jgi:hypothetical protein
VSDTTFEIFRTNSGLIYIGAPYLSSLLSQNKEESLGLLKVKLLVSLLSHTPYLLYASLLRPGEHQDSSFPLPPLQDDTRLDPRLFEHALFGGFINFSQVAPNSQLIDYILNHEDNWRDPFRDNLINKFPKLIKSTP